jgi:hypothetical protein
VTERVLAPERRALHGLDRSVKRPTAERRRLRLPEPQVRSGLGGEVNDEGRDAVGLPTRLDTTEAVGERQPGGRGGGLTPAMGRGSPG